MTLLTVASGSPLGLRTSCLIVGVVASRGVEGLQQLNMTGRPLRCSLLCVWPCLLISRLTLRRNV